MIVHYKNPITILIAESLFKGKLSEAHLHFNQPRAKPTDSFSKSKIYMSQEICRILKIKFKISTATNCQSKDICVTETSIKQYHFVESYLIFQASDAYCSFGFNKWKPNILTKLKLYRLWRSGIKGLDPNKIIKYNRFIDNEKKTKMIIIDTQKVVGNIKKVILNSKFESDLNRNFTSQKNYLLVLPPFPLRNKAKFVNDFFSYCEYLAKQKNLSLLIKPHQNDIYDYKQKLNHGEIYLVQEKDRYIPAEFFINYEKVAHIVAAPSSALAFADPSKLSVFIDNSSPYFKRNYLDQLPFLEAAGISYSTFY